MSPSLDLVAYPELIFGLAGPIGVDMDELTDSLTNALKSVRYDAYLIKVTSLMMGYETDVPKPLDPGYFLDINYKMDHANALCKTYGSGDTIARIAVREVKKVRQDITGDKNKIPQRIAYIIRQIERPEEVNLLRKVYGKQFILVSSYGSEDERSKRIERKLRRNLTEPKDVQTRVEHLVGRDANENDSFGQHLRDAFPLADVFVDGINRREMDAKITRFIQAFFGRTDISPSKDEYGMYAAKSASLRSSDLSRQIGAAIFSLDGEVITQGCNEVPKALGGTYWDLETPDHRDVWLGHDPNDLLKRELLRDLFQKLIDGRMLSPDAVGIGSASRIVDVVSGKKGADNDGFGAGVLSSASVMDLTEYGRIVHAEMCALCDAARLGKSVKGVTLFCTTFPCHNCTKHIIASGIKRVVYMEPYPKSKAMDLHENEIELEKESVNKVSFVPFLGISPARYRDIFQKGRRKKGDGTARRWYAANDEERPMIDAADVTYTELEYAALSPLIGENEKADVDENIADAELPKEGEAQQKALDTKDIPTTR